MPWGDPAILRQILKESQRIGDPHAADVFRRTAVQVGLVESGGRNLPGGDADSAGWRQERASLYANPTNVKASVARFRQEFQRFYRPGAKSYQLAAQIQRPAAQYRGRYRQVAHEAARVLAGAGSVSPQTGRPAAQAASASVPGGAGGVDLSGGSQGVSALLAQIGSQKPQIQTAGLQSPSFSASAAMAGTVPVSGGGPAPKTDISGLLKQIQTQGAMTPASAKPGDAGSLVPAKIAPGLQGPTSALQWAKSKVGFHETGTNSGGLASRLNKQFGFSNAPWCAMFTSAAVTHGGAPASARTASVAQVRAKAQAKQGYEGFVNPSRAQQGDLILWGTRHIGMVERVAHGKVYFVAGNHSDGVNEGSVAIGDGDIVRPKYGRR